MSKIKQSFKYLVVTAAVMAALPGYAEGEAQAVAPVPQTPPATPAPSAPPATAPQPAVQADVFDTELFHTYLAVARELSSALGERDARANIAAMEKFEFSPDTQAKLNKLFGNPKPLHVTSSAQADGGTEVNVTLDPLHYENADEKAHADWSGASAKAVFDKTFHKYHVTGQSDSFVVQSAGGTQVALTGMSLRSDLYQDSSSMWLGGMHGALAHLTVGKAEEPVASVEDVTLNADLVNRGRAFDLVYDVAVRRVSGAGDQLGPIHMGMRFTHLDKKAYLAFQDEARQLNTQTMNAKQHREETFELMQRFLTTSLAAGAGFELNDLSVNYRGHAARLTGHISTKPSAKPQTLEQAMEKANARFDLQVPLALAEDVAVSVFKYVGKSNGQLAADEEQLHAMAQGMVKNEVDKLVAEHYVRLDHDMIRASAEYRAGKLLLNGRPIAMPKLPLPSGKGKAKAQG